MGGLSEPFFEQLIAEINESERTRDSVFELGKKGSPITVEVLEKKCGTKQDLSRIIINLVNQMKKNLNMMKRAVGEIEKGQQETKQGHVQVMKLQKELLDCKSEQINTFHQSFDDQLKSYSDALMEKGNEQSVAVSDSSVSTKNTNKTLIRTVVNSAIKETNAALDRSKSLMLFGLEESEEEETKFKTRLTGIVKGLLEDIGIEEYTQPIARRLGTKRSDKPRPVRVTLGSSSEVHEILLKRKFLKTTDYYNVYMAPDRTPEEQKMHNGLVKKLKEKIKEMPEKRFYIKNGQIHCDEQAKKVTVNRDDDNYYMFDTASQGIPVKRTLASDSELLIY